MVWDVLELYEGDEGSFWDGGECWTLASRDQSVAVG